MNPIALALAGVFGIIAFIRSRQAYRYWRSPSVQPPRLPLLGNFGADIRAALERTTALYAAVFCSLSSTMLAGAFLPKGNHRHESFTIVSGVATFVGGVSILAMLASMLLTVIVVWFNVPKIVVPPHRRSDVGVRAQRRSARP